MFRQCSLSNREVEERGLAVNELVYEVLLPLLRLVRCRAGVLGFDGCGAAWRRKYRKILVDEVVKNIELMVGFRDESVVEIVKGYFMNYQNKQKQRELIYE